MMRRWSAILITALVTGLINNVFFHNVSQLTHIIGGIVGTAIGYRWNKKAR
jgi:hypothetical protein